VDSELRGLLDYVEKTGRKRHSRKARYERCPKCGLIVIVGWDSDMCATLAYVDPTPLSAEDELLCQLAGRAIYTLRNTGNRVEINDRDPRATPGAAGRPVYPAHVCGGRLGP
jgi:hypothetical protein